MMFDIKPLDTSRLTQIQAIIDNKTKPRGSLGKLEALAAQLALITRQESIEINSPVMLVFAGDHGIAEENVSTAPAAVTRQMVVNFLKGGAAINCFCRSNTIDIEVIDAGILQAIEDHRLLLQSLGLGTKNFTKEKAMPESVVDKGLQWGAQVVYRHANNGSNTIGLGEMGIGNSSSAAAIMAAVTGYPVEDCVGRGTGINDKVLNRKKGLIDKALQLHKQKLSTPCGILAAVGGFEIVQMVGAMLAGAERRIILLIDGFIATAAALVACQMNKHAKDYMVFCHQSNEHGHNRILEFMEVDTLLSLDLRLGEGTGAALAFPLLRAAACFYNDMASFDSAGVDELENGS